MKTTTFAVGLGCVVGAIGLLGLGALTLQPSPAQASAKFTQETGKACNFCHAPAPPVLNDAGKKFKENGNKL
jgi:hypothetical protein